MAMPVDIQPGQVARPPRVEFETRAIEAGVVEGVMTYRDVDFAIVTPPGTYSVWEGEAAGWIKQQEREPYHDILVRAYEAFKQGKEPPVEGTPIEMCTIFAPSEIKQMKKAGVRAVEDMAAWPDGNLGMFGMGAARLKQRAQSWMASARDVGGTAAKLDAQAATIETLQEQVKQLLAQQAEAKETLTRNGERQKLSLKKDNAA